MRPQRFAFWRWEDARTHLKKRVNWYSAWRFKRGVDGCAMQIDGLQRTVEAQRRADGAIMQIEIGHQRMVEALQHTDGATMQLERAQQRMVEELWHTDGAIMQIEIGQ